MAEQDKLLIRLHVYDTDLSVRIPREDEEYYRKSAKLIDDIVNSYAKIFKGRKSDKEILYMALIDVALRYEKESDRNDTKPYDDILEKLTAEIRQFWPEFEGFITVYYEGIFSTYQDKGVSGINLLDVDFYWKGGIVAHKNIQLCK